VQWPYLGLFLQEDASSVANENDRGLVVLCQLEHFVNHAINAIDALLGGIFSHRI
jgi:hypothetical protein